MMFEHITLFYLNGSKEKIDPVVLAVLGQQRRILKGFDQAESSPG